MIYTLLNMASNPMGQSDDFLIGNNPKICKTLRIGQKVLRKKLDIPLVLNKLDTKKGQKWVEEGGVEMVQQSTHAI